jgi:hypothetical protein
VPSFLLDKIFNALSDKTIQDLSNYIQPFHRITLSLSEEQTKKSFEIFVGFSIASKELIELFWKLAYNIQQESSLLPVWNHLLSNESELVSEFLCQYYLQKNDIQTFLNHCSRHFKSIGILKALLLMIKNVQCLNTYNFHSTFYLDSDFVQIQFNDKKTEPIFVVRDVFLLSVIQEIRNRFLIIIQDFDPFHIFSHNEIISVTFGKTYKHNSIQPDFSIFKNLQLLFNENNQEMSQLVFSICLYLPPEML